MQKRRVVPLLIRDLLLVAATLALWNGVLRAGDESATAIALNILAGLMTVLTGYLAHEWGHLLGAWSRNSVVQLPTRLTSTFLFNFDVGCNDRRQFNAMAAGGFVASIVFVVLLLILVPWNLLAGKIALSLTAIGVAATFILEVPTAWRVLRGAPLPSQGPAFVSTSGLGSAATRRPPP